MENKKNVESITSRDVDFAKWYTDVVTKADLADYSDIKGCMIIRPYGYAIWENIQKILDSKFKDTEHQNLYMPMFIPESLLQKEKDHIEGFAPEVAWGTHGGNEKLAERLCIRPTSETLFCQHFAKIVHSYRDLPILYNQWCSVVRLEKTTRPFLRSTEFLWQEGHTIHATKEEAIEETLKMLNIYDEFCKNSLAIPMLTGQKTENEKFAGAVSTYTIESLMYDGKALQSGTSHYFGDNFAKPFGIQYSDKENKLQYVHQTSWGISTRLIGAIIMVHGDDNGLILPPAIAPIQVMIIPIAMHKEGVLDKVNTIKNNLSSKLRIKVDNSDKTPGWKFSEQEMKGIPLRLEIGPKDIENNQAVAVRRDTNEKIILKLDELENEIPKILNQISKNLYDKALENKNRKTYCATNWEEFVKIGTEQPGYIKAMFCGEKSCEQQIKEKTTITSRCIPFNQENLAQTCVHCGKPAKNIVYWGKAY